MERIRCPNPKCGRHILDIEVMSPGKSVLEMKCRHCGEVGRWALAQGWYIRRTGGRGSPAIFCIGVIRNALCGHTYSIHGNLWKLSL